MLGGQFCNFLAAALQYSSEGSADAEGNQFFEILSRADLTEPSASLPLPFNGRSDREMASFNLEPVSI